jgi:hypothetical protein
MKIIGLENYAPSMWDVETYHQAPQQLTSNGQVVLTQMEEKGLLPTKADFERGYKQSNQLLMRGEKVRNVFYQPLSTRASEYQSSGLPKVREIWSVSDVCYLERPNQWYLRPNKSRFIPDYRPLFVIVTPDSHRYRKDRLTGTIYHLVPVHLILPLSVSYGPRYVYPFSIQYDSGIVHPFAIVQSGESLEIRRDMLQRRIMRLSKQTLNQIHHQGYLWLHAPANKKLWNAYSYFEEQQYYLGFSVAESITALSETVSQPL